MTDRAEWIFLAQSHVGARDGELANRRRVMQVAEVDKADDLVSIHQNVVIVGVAVNHATAQRRKVRSHCEDLFDQRRLGGEMQIIADPGGAFQVPLQFVVSSSMTESR